MKKTALVILILVAAAVVISCLVPFAEYEENSVDFYFSRKSYGYGSKNSVIARESRELSGYSQELSYLLTLYLEGPLEESLEPVFPDSVQIENLKMTGTQLEITLSDLTEDMADAEFSLACACLTKTCLGLTQAQAVRIASGDRIIRMDTENLILYDNSSSVEIPETEETQ